MEVCRSFVAFRGSRRALGSACSKWLRTTEGWCLCPGLVREGELGKLLLNKGSTRALYNWLRLRVSGRFTFQLSSLTSKASYSDDPGRGSCLLSLSLPLNPKPCVRALQPVPTLKISFILAISRKAASLEGLGKYGWNYRSPKKAN